MKWTARVVRNAGKLGGVFPEPYLKASIWSPLAPSFVCGRVDQALKMPPPSVLLYTEVVIADE